MIIVMGKYLLVLVAYDTYKGQPGQVQGHFEKFNREFGQVCEAFLEVTKLEFQLGRKITPVRQYSPSDKNQIDLEQFLERHQLEDLQGILLKEGVTLKILLKMTEEDMKELGIKKVGRKKQLLEAIREEHGQLPKQPFESQPAILADSIDSRC